MTIRNILLIEPGYKNKYPPIGLMKIATYHRILGDNVVFYKGSVREFTINNTVDNCIKKLNKVISSIDWNKKHNEIDKYIRTAHTTKLKKILSDLMVKDNKSDGDIALSEKWLKYFSDSHKNKQYDFKWDRIYITTLFTFYWNITVQAIHDAKHIVKSNKELKVGGVLASLLVKEVETETGIKPLAGLLDKPGMLDPKRKKAQALIIDDLPLDYSILDETDYKYPTGSAYFTFMTKGCTRKCKFCSVPKLEPTYKDKIATKDKFEVVKDKYGEQRNLLLMDNNVLGSPKFPEIIQEIKDMGFTKGAKFIEPNQLDIAIKNLKLGNNNTAYINRSYQLIQEFLNKRVKGKNQQIVYDICDQFNILKLETTTKPNLIKAYKKLKEIYQRYRNKASKNKYVDFNQGTDARYINDENMRLISEIPINPLRIAFDYWGIRKQYEKSVRLASKYGINKLSNYLLYNFKDKPVDLYNRIKLNVELSDELDIHIYSFPMKFIPLFGEQAKHRHYISEPLWNKKFIRAIQSISNVTKGIVPPGRSFFEKAYGKSEQEFFELLYMPEVFIVYRKLFDEDLNITNKWRHAYNLIRQNKKLWSQVKVIIEENDFNNLKEKTNNKNIINFLQFYKITRNDVKGTDTEHIVLKKKFSRLVNDDLFMDLSLTYDYDDSNDDDEYHPIYQTETQQLKIQLLN